MRVKAKVNICEYKLNEFVSGYVDSIDALATGKACHALGCGRTRPGLPVQHEPGVVLNCKPGDFVSEGDVTLTVHHDGSENSAKITERLVDAVLIKPNKPQLPPLVLEMMN